MSTVEQLDRKEKQSRFQPPDGLSQKTFKEALQEEESSPLYGEA